MSHDDDIARMMVDALDSGDDEAMRAWLEEHPERAEEWNAVLSVDQLLRSDRDLAPPPGFAEGVLQAIAADEARQPSWQRGLLAVALIATGVLSAIWMVIAVSSRWQLADAQPWAGALLDATSVSLSSAAQLLFGGAMAWFVALALAGAMAAVWFGVLVVPRLEPVDLEGRG